MSRKSERKRNIEQDISPQEKRKIDRSHIIKKFTESLKSDIKEAMSTTKTKPTKQETPTKKKVTIKQEIISLSPSKNTENNQGYTICDSDAPHVSFNSPDMPLPNHASAKAKKPTKLKTGFSDSSGAISDPVFDDDSEQEPVENNVQPQNNETESSEDETPVQRIPQITKNTVQNKNLQNSDSDDSYGSDQNKEVIQKIINHGNNDSTEDSDDVDDNSSANNNDEEENQNSEQDDISDDHASNEDGSDEDNDSNDKESTEDDDDDSDDDVQVLGANDDEDDSSDEPYVVETITDTRKNEIRNNRKQRNVFDY